MIDLCLFLSLICSGWIQYTKRKRETFGLTFPSSPVGVSSSLVPPQI